MRTMSLNELNDRICKNRNKKRKLMKFIDELVEASPEFSSERRRPKDETEAMLLKRLKYK